MFPYINGSNKRIIVGVIGRNRPYILRLTTMSNYDAHWVIGYGYNSNSSSSYAIVNDGHGRTGAAINLSYMDLVVHWQIKNMEKR